MFMSVCPVHRVGLGPGEMFLPGIVGSPQGAVLNVREKSQLSWSLCKQRMYQIVVKAMKGHVLKKIKTRGEEDDRGTCSEQMPMSLLRPEWQMTSAS